MKKAFLKSIREEYPNEEITRLVFADWCAENKPELEHKLRRHFPVIDNLIIDSNYGFGNGTGYEYGYGDGNGNGNGNGTGSGIGYGYGIGIGIGSGYRSGSGIGYSRSGSGIGYNNQKLNMPKINKNQLIFLPFGFIFCGFVQEHIQPYQFKITNASIVLSHNSTWEEVANNTNRNINSRKYGIITIGPQFFHSIDWIGDLP